MTIMQQAPAAVHAIDEHFPETGQRPTLEDLAYDTGYVVGLEDGVYRAPAGWSPERRLRLAMGRQAGLRARGEREARELGHAGFEGGISEPPGGLSENEKAAYRAGYREALEDHEGWLAERDRGFAEYDAWRDSCPDVHYDEVTRAIGCIEARKGGGA